MTEMDDLTAAVVALAEANIPPDTQELLVSGNPDRGVAPGALARALAAQRLKHEAEIAELEQADGEADEREAALTKWAERASTAEALLAEAREVIAPFAMHAPFFAYASDTDEPDFDGHSLMVKDFRRAAAFIERIAK